MFKTTARRNFQASEVAASARQFKDQVHQGLAGLLAARLREGEQMPDLALFQELIGRLLDSNVDSIKEIDGRYTNQLVNTAAVRAARNELVASLRRRMREVGFLLERAVPGGVFKAALRDRRLSKLKPLVLVAGARDLAATLRDPNLTVSAAGSSLATSAETMAVALETEALQLEQLIGELQKKSSQEELGNKVADLRAAAETTQRCSELLFGLYRLGGLEFHAERLRSRDRRRRVEEKEKPTPAPASSTALVVQVV